MVVLVLFGLVLVLFFVVLGFVMFPLDNLSRPLTL